MKTEGDKRRRRAWAKTEKGKAAQARWVAKNPDYHTDFARKRRARDPEYVKALRRKSRYKVAATRKCPDNCECCGVPFSKTAKGSCFDHDHKTGKFRGWLCFKCNAGLGKLGDCKEGILRMLRYLEDAELLS